MARGGRRSGVPGVAHANRTDLNAPSALPIQAATGQPYGQAQQQEQGQKVVPLRAASTAPPAPEGVSESAPTPPPSPLPGSFGAFDRPTERPNEPISATPPPQSQPASGQAMAIALQALARTSGSPALMQLAQKAAAQNP